MDREKLKELIMDSGEIASAAEMQECLSPSGWSPFGDERTSFYADESEIIGNIHEEVTK